MVLTRRVSLMQTEEPEDVGDAQRGHDDQQEMSAICHGRSFGGAMWRREADAVMPIMSRR